MFTGTNYDLSSVRAPLAAKSVQGGAGHRETMQGVVTPWKWFLICYTEGSWEVNGLEIFCYKTPLAHPPSLMQAMLALSDSSPPGSSQTNQMLDWQKYAMTVIHRWQSHNWVIQVYPQVLLEVISQWEVEERAVKERVWQGLPKWVHRVLQRYMQLPSSFLSVQVLTRH